MFGAPGYGLKRPSRVNGHPREYGGCSSTRIGYKFTARLPNRWYSEPSAAGSRNSLGSVFHRAQLLASEVHQGRRGELRSRLQIVSCYEGESPFIVVVRLLNLP